MAITFEITFGKGDKQTTRKVEIEPKEISLGFLEDMEIASETKQWAIIRPAYADLLGLTRDESRALTTGQFEQLTTAFKDAMAAQATIPNG